MDLRRYNKPIHITCPKCREDLEFSGGKIVAEKNLLRDELKTIMAKMQSHKIKCGRDSYYKQLLKQYNEKMAQYERAKQLVTLLSDQSERMLFELFKAECKKRWGNETINAILNECEDECFYRTEELMKQNHTNFENATEQ